MIDVKRYNRILILMPALPLAAMLLLAGILVWQVQKLRAAAAWVDHTDQVLAQANATLKLMLDAETGERGYLIGGERLFLDPYERAQREVGSALDALARLVADSPRQAQRVRAFRADYARWEENARREIALYRQGKDVRPAFDRAVGKQRMDELRAQFAAFAATEVSRRRQRVEEVRAANRLTLGIAAGLALLLGGLLAFLTRRQIATLSGLYSRALTQVQENERRLETTLTSIGDAVIATDAAGRITFMNPVAEQLTGWTQAEAAEKEAAQVFHIINEETRREAESPIARILREGVVVGLANHTLLVNKAGAETPIDDCGSPMRDANGNLVGAVLVFRDVAENKRREAEILALNARLRRAMAETHHRVRNNLQIIVAMIDMQKMEYAQTLPTEELDRIGAHIRTLSAIHDLLTEQAKIDGQAQSLSVRQLLEKLLPMLQETAPGCRLRFRIDEAFLPTRRATSLALIVNELVTNAVKYGKGEIDVRFTVDGERGVLEVADDGPGLPIDFDPVRSAHTGLALVENLTQMDLSGQTRYENRPESGARISIVVPLPAPPEVVPAL
jgi:PAS domain S-box-containing protein